MQKPRHSAGSAPLPSAECGVGISTLAKRGGRGAHDKTVHACTTVLDELDLLASHLSATDCVWAAAKLEADEVTEH